MYCQSCQTKLSPRDRNCPTCGRRAARGGDLGAGSGNEDSKSFSLPPAQSLDEEASSSSSSAKTRKETPRKAASASRRKSTTERRQAPERRKPASEPAPPPRRSAEPDQDFGLRPQDVLGLLVEKPSLIEGGLEIYKEDGEAVGANFATAVGEIDLLARDNSGGWVIIAVAEPEHGKEIVPEMLQRIGWVRRHLGQSGEEVRGIVLLSEMPDDLGYAAAAVADTVEFRLYQLALTFEPVIL